MAEGRYVVCESHRKLTTPDAFYAGALDFPCPLGAPNAIDFRRSYFRVGMTLYGQNLAGIATPPAAHEMVAFADNAVGNLFDKAEVMVNNMSISNINQHLPQASALQARLNNGNAWLKSLGSTEMHESNFPKRALTTARALKATSPDAFASNNEMYRPVAAGHFSDAAVSITEIGTNTTTVDKAGVEEDATVVTGLTQGGTVTGVDTDFKNGMPDFATGAPTGAAVLPGDILVVDGVQYPITAVTDATTLSVAYDPSVEITDATDWYIIRKDIMRSPQAKNTVYAIWRPPIGIFDYDGLLGCGNYTMHLSPNSRYLTSAVETRNPTAVASIDGKSNDYSLIVNSVTFFAYVVKPSIPDEIRTLHLHEYQVVPHAWEPNMQFTVSPNTVALSVFVQDVTAGANPRIPQSMFKVLDNSDLKLATIQVVFGGTPKPAQEVASYFYNGVDQMQQYYRDTYAESGLYKSNGAETYYDFLQRGPFYHYTFIKDIDNLATEVTVSTTFTGLPNGPGSGVVGGTGRARVFVVAHYKKTMELETSAGNVKRVNTVGARSV